MDNCSKLSFNLSSNNPANLFLWPCLHCRENERLEVYEAEIEDLRQQLEFVSRQEQQQLKDEAEK